MSSLEIIDVRKKNSFTLVEVVLALGIMSFCLLPLIGLFSIGLDTLKNSREEAAAAVCLNQIAEAVRSAPVNAAGAYQALGIYTNLSWSNQSVLYPMSDISLCGIPTTIDSDKRLAAYVNITPPIDAMTSGLAFITVAWPNRAQWNDTTKKWSREQGSVSAWVILFANQ